MNKGFTLIELLAVIIILAVIALIATPIILGIVENAKKNTFKDTAYGISNAAQNAYVEMMYGGEEPKDIVFNYNNGVETSDPEDYALNYSGAKPKNGYVLLNSQGKVSLKLYDGKYCATKGYDDAEITIEAKTLNECIPPEQIIVTLNGNSSVNIEIGGTYTELGATAKNENDDVLEVTITGTVDTNTVGTYTITYTADDGNGNVATATRTITVSAPNYAGPGYITSKGTNGPVLATGMVPIKWNGSAWVDTTTGDSTWYNYTTTDKQWANARTADGSMWVWVPRYAYQIASGYHTATASTINIKFLQGTTNTTSDSTTIYDDSASNTHYVKEPAFTFGTTQLTGFWVAKFEMSGTTGSLDSKPNVAALKSITLANMFIASRNMETNNKYGWALASGLNITTGVFSTDTNNIDAHMIKNSEWGAITYLAQSTYGKNSEIIINASVNFYTGGGAYVTNTNQSTTGNIYGIYDMSGGSCEYTMGNYNNTPGSSGLTPSSIDSKYINIYSTTGSGYDASNYGDAIYETSSSSSNYTSWYGDASIVVSTASPWFERGGYYGDGAIGGPYNFYGFSGAAHAGYSWRSVIAVGAGL